MRLPFLIDVVMRLGRGRGAVGSLEPGETIGGVSTPPSSPYDVVVVGAGLAGLAAAREIADAGRSVLVLESSPRVGGKLHLAEVGAVTVDVGAEAMLARRPEGLALAAAAELPVEDVALASSAVWSRGALRPLPRGVMGAPVDLEQLRASGVLSETGLARAAAEGDLGTWQLDPEEDRSVGELVDQRFGPEVTDRLVEPLLGGVYAGHARELSVRACTPQLLDLLATGPLLGRALPSAPGPVFAGIVGGMGRLPVAIAADERVEVRTEATVRALRRTPEGFVLTVGPTRAPEQVSAARVVLATPASPTARLLSDVAPGASTALQEIEYASMAVVTFAFRVGDLPDLSGSGFLVPPVEGRRIKAATFSFAKWDWVRRAGESADQPVRLLRASIGRHREERVLQVADDDLAAAALADLGEATGLTSRPVDTHVQRWGGGLPQYAVGHRDRVARIRAAVAEVPGLAVCGAAYDGVGIPAVIASAQAAVARVLTPDD